MTTIILAFYTYKLAQLVNIEQARDRREQQEKRCGELRALLGAAKNLRDVNPANFVKDWEKSGKLPQPVSFIRDLALASQNIKDADTVKSFKKLKAILDAFEYSTNTRPNFLDFANELKTVQDRIVCSITEWEEELGKLSY